MVLCSWVSRLHIGGNANVLLPVYAMVAILFGLGIQRLLLLAGRASLESERRAMKVVISLCALISFAPLHYALGTYIPSRNDLKNASRLIETLRQQKGDIFMPLASFAPILAGKRGFADGHALWDVFSGPKGALHAELLKQLSEDFKNQRFTAVVLPHRRLREPRMLGWRKDPNWFWWLDAGMEQSYQLRLQKEDLKVLNSEVWGKRQLRPAYFYVPKKQGAVTGPNAR